MISLNATQLYRAPKVQKTELSFKAVALKPEPKRILEYMTENTPGQSFNVESERTAIKVNTRKKDGTLLVETQPPGMKVYYYLDENLDLDQIAYQHLPNPAGPKEPADTHSAWKLERLATLCKRDHLGDMA